MDNVSDLLFEADMLKEIPRSGFHFLGAGRESVAEHVHMTTFTAFVMAKLDGTVDVARLLSMCMVHDLPEARTGDLNLLQKRYVHASEETAVSDLAAGLPFGDDIAKLLTEFNDGESPEAKIANDADHLSLLLSLKSLKDVGCQSTEKWIPNILDRLKTDIGRSLARSILDTPRDRWWLKALAG